MLPMGEATLPSDTHQGQTEDKKGELERGGCKEDKAEDTDGRRLEGVVHPE